LLKPLHLKQALSLWPLHLKLEQKQTKTLPLNKRQINYLSIRS
jgi:hypothetical protein